MISHLLRNLFIGLLILIGLAGCEESVDPVIGEERPFTLWGFMDSGADTQRVHVVAIESRLGVDRSGPIDARVVSADLETGERREWRDAETTFPDSSVGHVFWSPFRPEAEHRYRLEVERSDGAMSSVEIKVPQPVGVRLQDDAENQDRVSVFIDGTDLNLVRLQAVYEAFTLPPLNPWPPGSTPVQTIKLPVTISYNGEERPSGDGLRVVVNMVEDFNVIVDEFGRNCLPTDLIGLGRITFDFLVADDAWMPPGGLYDPEVLSQPGAFSNVENGFGFFGAGFTAKAQWFPSSSVKTGIGYILGGGCVLMAADIPACRVLPPPCFQDN
jgi:hypothetical protein